MARVRVWGVFIALVLLAIGLLVTWYQSRDVFTGARGPFPAAFAAGAPVAPDRVVRRAWDAHALEHGLFLQDTAFGVTAVNLRTGKEYWRYERRGEKKVSWDFKVSERTVVVGHDDGRLVGIDLRTGKLLWRVEIQEDGYRSVELADGQVVTDAPSSVRAFDERDGRSLWTVKMPESCPEVLLFSVHALPHHLSAAHVICNATSLDRDEYSLLLGVDNRTGKVLWRQPTVDPKLTAWGDGHTLAAPDPDHPQTIQLLDINRQGISTRATLPLDEWDVVAAGSGTVLSGTDPEEDSEDHDTLLQAYDIRDGRTSWQLRAPAGQEYGFPEIADGRVYVVRQPFLAEADAGRRIRADLLILDADSGRLLHTLRLPAMTTPDDPDYFEKLDILNTADGAVSIGWRDGEGDLLIATN
ncbi:PQQ-binding-like beta-propeller repeat protein [Streptomyces sp. NBC_00151]|uniref:PQQ-binding-like beta-propeller repeat protein n=1 Tax=Streptomyces sp. NBC_00151 TaxID=2975669 RepID=UPI002DDBC785|nr:PQQ-binding-like beta-propeller repeat protein [Streptomyces sp. NBC_00151]WRZ38728.1 PQQ-like beta-propeller repeat protein [Streptomyces sp. NBC_00151]